MAKLTLTGRARVFALIAIGVGAFLGLTLAQLSRFFIGGGEAFSTGTVAPRDVRAPTRVSIVNDTLTRNQRDAAEANVAPIYSPPDAQVARKQLATARETLDRIAIIRADNTQSDTSKLRTLLAVPAVKIEEPIARVILRVSDLSWTRMDAQVITLLDQNLREPIRPEGLDIVRARLPGQVSLSFSADETAVISALGAALLAPNVSFDAAATDAAKRNARAAVQPVQLTYEASQIIIRSGQVVTAAELETLDKLNLRRSAMTWLDALNALALAALAVVTIGLSMWRQHFGQTHELLHRPLRESGLSALLIVVAVVLGRWLLPGHGFVPYLAPMLAVGIVVAAWSGVLAGAAAAATTGALIGIGLDRPIEFAALYACGGVIATLSIRRSERVGDFVRAGIWGFLAQLGVIIAFHAIGFQASDLAQIALYIVGAFAACIIAAALALAILYLAGAVFDLPSAIHMNELSRPSHPLLRQMLSRAPGTYHHSLMVANLAEHAADRIGADALLTRVGAYYHDIGKTAHPYFFIENQLDRDRNPHSEIDPLTSARILHNHVLDGMQMARERRLPSSIRAFIAEHHGTMVTRSAYARAQKDSATPVEEGPFRYPGPVPQRRETALLMLADASEATVRALRPTSPEEMDQIVRRVIAERVTDHQLDDSGLTLRDLDRVALSFVETLRGAYHPRIDYPQLSGPSPAPASVPPPPAEITPPLVGGRDQV
ncbi:MAG: HDIG domain-containing protein [Thermoflexales bacterium]|nr:HDIG domain-containing protein [Thermoflexales bacterium]